MDPSSYTYPHKPPNPSPQQPRRSSRRSRRSSHTHTSAAVPRLGAIAEDAPTILPDTTNPPPPLPQRVHHRPLSRMFHLGFPPLYGAHGEKPPDYSEAPYHYRDVKGPNGEDFGDLRGNRKLGGATGRRKRGRGGWWRLGCVAALVVVVVVVAVGVGVGVGLGKGKGKGKSKDSSPPDPAQNNNNNTHPFPLGSYSFSTFLSTVATLCTPNAATWSCFPYQTYNQSTTGSLATFNWIVTSSSSSTTTTTTSSSSSPSSSPSVADNLDPTGYLISSSNNPWALTFTNTTLHLVDAGTPAEALTFMVPMQKVVVPNVDITGTGAAARCFYDEAVLVARLYVKKGKTYPVGDGGDGGGDLEFQPWPYAVEVNQTAGAGAGVPDCHRMVDGKVGEKVDLAGAGVAGECRCGYQNFGT